MHHLGVESVSGHLHVDKHLVAALVIGDGLYFEICPQGCDGSEYVSSMAWAPTQVPAKGMPCCITHSESSVNVARQAGMSPALKAA